MGWLTTGLVVVLLMFGPGPAFSAESAANADPQEPAFPTPRPSDEAGQGAAGADRSDAPSPNKDAETAAGLAALEEAVARAEAAAEQAALAARAVDQANRKSRRRSERKGPYFGGAFFYAAENFDDRIIVKSSTGGAGFIGYRFAPMLAAEIRYEGFEGFDLEGSRGRGVIDGSALTLSGKAYPFPGPIQPFVGVGLGAMFLKQKLVFNDGSRARSEESDVAFRFAAGLDIWLTESLVLNLEAAYLAPADELSDLDSTVLSTGLTYRF